MQRCEKVSKCIFDLGLTQQRLDRIINTRSCEKVSKCIFDLGLTQRIKRFCCWRWVVKRFQNVSLT